jgi:hypothetical protein
MAKISRFFEDINVTTSGIEILDVIGGNKFVHSGTIDQIVIESSSGSASIIEVQLRYIAGISSRHRLAYLFIDGGMPLFVDSNINGSFSLYDVVGIDGDLHLYLETDSDSIVNIRIDMDINNIAGI